MHHATRLILTLVATLAAVARAAAVTPDSLAVQAPATLQVPGTSGQYPEAVVTDEFTTAGGRLTLLGSDTIPVIPAAPDSLPVIMPFDKFAGYNQWEERDVEYNPDPTRAVWMSALCPGLGQVYNRRYWKLPIITGGYLGLAYATSWNNSMLGDYTRAYRDIMDSDPTTKSYMDFFPPTVKEEDLDKTWLTNILQSRKNYFRRNRDLCIICMVGVYFLAMVDAYVDASLSHFDISPDLTLDVAPALIQDSRGRLPSVGMVWAFTF